MCNQCLQLACFYDFNVSHHALLCEQYDAYGITLFINPDNILAQQYKPCIPVCGRYMVVLVEI